MARKTDADADSDAASDAVSRREMAVARSLDSARTRAENRVQRFLDAALELMNDGSGKEFTVQEVVERSGQSLRSFYQYFGGKHELLLASFEEVVGSSADQLRASVADIDDPLERVHRFVVEYYRMCRPAPKAKNKKGGKEPIAPVMVEFAQQLLTAHPAEAARAFEPIVSLFRQLLDDAAEAGAIRSGLRHGAIAGVVLEAIMFNAFSSTIGGERVEGDSGDAAEELWDVLFNGLGTR